MIRLGGNMATWNELKATIIPANIFCVLYGHDFDKNGRCVRKVPNLFDKTKQGGKCSGKKDTKV